LGQWDTWKRQLPKGQESAETSPYSTVVSGLRSKCPTAVDDTDWQQAIMDSDRFMEQWVDQAAALGWTARDLFGLAPVPDRASPNFRRLSRYDLTGLIWLLRGRPVVAVTENSAAIQGSSGAVTIYRKNSKPALGPLGDGLDDLEGAQFAGGAESDVT
jgi:hypothetical protein